MQLATASIPAGPNDIKTTNRALTPLPVAPFQSPLSSCTLFLSTRMSAITHSISTDSNSNHGNFHSSMLPSNGSIVRGKGSASTITAPSILPARSGRTIQSSAMGILFSSLSLPISDIADNASSRVISTAISSKSLLLLPGPK